MSNETSISWTNVTWNPVTGCTRISRGCRNCYARRMTARLQRIDPAGKYAAGFDQVVCHPEILDEPRRYRTPRLIFVNSMSDTFHPDVPLSFVRNMWTVMNDREHLTFQVLTKRPERMAKLAGKLKWTDNIWAGTTVEAAKYIDRLDYLRRVPAKVRFISAEPLLSRLAGVRLRGINWLIVAGESGPGARPCDPDAVRELRDLARDQGVAFHFKQWGTLRSNPDPHDSTAKENGGDAKGGRLLDGKLWDEFPDLDR